MPGDTIDSGVVSRMPESPGNPFNDLLVSLARQSSGKDGRDVGFAIGSYRGRPNDGTESALTQHMFTMTTGSPARFERAIGNSCTSYFKTPGALSLFPASAFTALRARSDFGVILCTLDPILVNEVDAELDQRPREELRVRTDIQDPAAQQLIKLLRNDFAEEHPAGRVYTDHLIHALACRFLLAGRVLSRSGPRQDSALPGHILCRVVERMRTLDGNLSLQALAKESGYSRRHFQRMFRAAMGCNPHNYLLNLRIERARKLLPNATLSLTEIALECGFSSHSHLTSAFHRVIGVTPARYRRGS